MRVPSIRVLYAACFLLANLAFLSIGMLQGARQIAAENGLIENAQAFLIFAAFATFVLIAHQHRGAAQTGAVLLASACFAILFREIDLPFMHAPLPMSRIMSARDLSLLIILSLLVLFVAGRKSDVPEMLKQLRQPCALVLLAVVALIATGELIEELAGKQPLALLLEEMVELNAYALLLVAAVHFPTETGAVCRPRFRRSQRLRPGAKLRDTTR